MLRGKREEGRGEKGMIGKEGRGKDRGVRKSGEEGVKGGRGEILLNTQLVRLKLDIKLRNYILIYEVFYNKSS